MGCKTVCDLKSQPWTRFPKEVWIIFVVEFVERLGYYAVSFTLFTYCTNMLRTGTSTANVILNALSAIVPVAACGCSGFSDGFVGRPRCLAVALVIYMIGLILMAISSAPFLYHNFPLDPSVASYVLFGVSLLTFGAGYGSVKVCTNPLMADSVSNVEPVEPTCRKFATEDAVATAAWQQEELLSCLFRWIYWITNVGATIGIFVAPFLRNLDHRYVEVGDSKSTTGYYYGYSVAAVSVAVGAIIFLLALRIFQRNKPSPTFVLMRVLVRAVRRRFQFAMGTIRDDAFLDAHRWDLLDFAAYTPGQPDNTAFDGEPYSRNGGKGANSTPSNKGIEPEFGEGLSSDDGMLYEVDDVTHIGWVLDCKATVRVCRAFVPLPVYWLICNQFSTNLMSQASALNVPTNIPPEVFENVNTLSMLAFLFICDRMLYPLLYSGRAPPLRGRIIIGCVLMIASMVWCGTLQVFINKRGAFDNFDFYVLNKGEERMSAGWLFPPFVMQGMASALVDPTVMEAAYIGAPTRMKGTVMALYWVASSVSGFLGMAISPVMKPSKGVPLFYSFAGALVLVTVLFFFLNDPRVYSVVDREETHVAHSNTARDEAATKMQGREKRSDLPS